MWEESNSEVHGTSDIDGNFLVRFGKVEVVYLEGSLDAGVIDEAIYIRMVMDYGLDEGGDRGDVTRVEDVVDCIMTHLSGGGTEGGLGAADNDDLLTLRNEIFCHCAAQAATATGDYGGIERREDRWSHFWYRLKVCELE